MLNTGGSMRVQPPFKIGFNGCVGPMLASASLAIVLRAPF